MEIKELRKQTGLSQSKFGEYFNIPTRTIQKWEIGQSTPPPYIPQMMERIINLEIMVKNANSRSKEDKAYEKR